MSIKFYGELFNGSNVPTKAVSRACDVAARTGVYVLQSNTPVKTGLLRSAWEVRPAGRGIQIHNDTPYAIFQEMGTRHMAGRHMIGRSMPAIEAAFVNELANQFGKLIGARIIGQMKTNPVIGTYAPKDKTVYGRLTKGEKNVPKKGISNRKFYRGSPTI